MKLIQYIDYFVNTTDTDDLLLYIYTHVFPAVRGLNNEYSSCELYLRKATDGINICY